MHSFWYVLNSICKDAVFTLACFFPTARVSHGTLALGLVRMHSAAALKTLKAKDMIDTSVGVGEVLIRKYNHIVIWL